MEGEEAGGVIERGGSREGGRRSEERRQRGKG